MTVLVHFFSGHFLIYGRPAANIIYVTVCQSESTYYKHVFLNVEIHRTDLFLERIILNLVKRTSKSHPVLDNQIDWIRGSLIYFLDVQMVIIY